jgi:hypothetical protein
LQTSGVARLVCFFSPKSYTHAADVIGVDRGLPQHEEGHGERPSEIADDMQLDIDEMVKLRSRVQTCQQQIQDLVGEISEVTSVSLGTL